MKSCLISEALDHIVCWDEFTREEFQKIGVQFVSKTNWGGGGVNFKWEFGKGQYFPPFFPPFPYILKKKTFDTAAPAFGGSSTFLQIHNINRKSQPATRNTKASLNFELKTKWVTNGVYDKKLFKSWWFWRRKIHWFVFMVSSFLLIVGTFPAKSINRSSFPSCLNQLEKYVIIFSL